ncbi:exosortase [Sphingomonas sp. FW199]|uniref:exosortase n=1 Tax=Sphingomonas sp. FW199 TaxID=3400217 RepID=UPI003CF5A2CA
MRELAAVAQRRHWAMADPAAAIGAAGALAGIALMALPLLIEQATGAWRTDQGGHGPFLLLLGLWLLGRHMPGPRQPPRTVWPAGAALAVTLIVYLLARLAAIEWVAWVAMIAAAALVTWLLGGTVLLRRIAFPLLFLALLLPPPGLVSAPMILALSLALADLAARIFWLAGVDAASSQSMIYLGPYELHVADACAGMGSLVGLSAIGMLYLHLRHGGDWRQCWIMVPVIVPIAVVANLLRILTLMVVTLWLGDCVAQSWVHPAAGLILFGFAIAMLVALDRLIVRDRPA